MAARANIDWDSQPLGLEPDDVIAERVGVAPGSVAKARRTRGIDRIWEQPNEVPAWVWESLDYSRPAEDNAKRLGVPVSEVHRNRARYAPDSPAKTPKRKGAPRAPTAVLRNVGERNGAPSLFVFLRALGVRPGDQVRVTYDDDAREITVRPLA